MIAITSAFFTVLLSIRERAADEAGHGEYYALLIGSVLGMVLLAERMDHVQSAAMNFLVPAGCVYDTPAMPGIASVLSEMITRGSARAATCAMIWSGR